MENLYEGIPTYYVELIKSKENEINHLQWRWNQMHTMRNNAINAGKAERAEEIKSKMMLLSSLMTVLKEKIKSYTTCQCVKCKV